LRVTAPPFGMMFLNFPNEGWRLSLVLYEHLNFVDNIRDEFELAWSRNLAG
jgi:hypothetical protein